MLEADTLLAPGLSAEAERFAECFDDADQTEGMRAFLEKRAPSWVANAKCDDK